MPESIPVEFPKYGFEPTPQALLKRAETLRQTVPELVVVISFSLKAITREAPIDPTAATVVSNEKASLIPC